MPLKHAILQAEAGDCSDSQASVAATVFYPSRKLNREVSLDENGYPMMLSEPMGSKSESSAPTQTVQRPVGVQQTSKAMLTWSKKPKLAPSAEDRQALMSCGHDSSFFAQLTADLLHPHDASDKDEQAVSSPKVASKRQTTGGASSSTSPEQAAAKQKAATKANAAPKRKVPAVDSEFVATKENTRKLGIVRYNPASAQSYITHQIADGKKALVVSVSQSMSSNHKALCFDIFKAIVAKNLDKPQALAMRSRLLKAS